MQSLRDQYIDLCASLEPTHKVELISNYPTPISEMREMVAQFVFRMKQSDIVSGPPRDRRMDFGGVFFLEISDESTRAVGIIVAPSFEFKELQRRVGVEWEAVCCSGVVECDLIVFPSGCLLYATKSIPEKSYDLQRLLFMP